MLAIARMGPRHARRVVFPQENRSGPEKIMSCRSHTLWCACRSAEILAASVDGTVRRFDVRGGCVYVDQMHAPVTSMALSHDGNCVLASCLDARLRLLDKASGELLAEYKGAQHPRLPIALSIQLVMSLWINVSCLKGSLP